MKNILVLILVASMNSLSFANEPEAVPNEYIVKLKESRISLLQDKVSMGRLLGGIVTSTFVDEPDLLVLKSEIDPKVINANPLVEFAEPNYYYYINATPDDPMFNQTWGLKNNDGGPDINAERAWDITTGNKEVVVAVVDTGIDINHPDLKANIWVNKKELNGKSRTDDDGNGLKDDIYGFNFYNNNNKVRDDNSHGTHVAGTIGARGNNTLGVAGVNWRVKLMAIKCFSSRGRSTASGLIKSINYAVNNGANVINASWGTSKFSAAMERAITKAHMRGVLFVAAAGNNGTDNDSEPHFPSNYDVPNILAVAAIQSDGSLSKFKKGRGSNFGATKVDIAAPGSLIMSTIPSKKYKAYSGTSMATPHVAGVAALVLGNEAIGHLELKERLMGTSKKLSSLSGKVVTGGMVDAHRALTNTRN